MATGPWMSLTYAQTVQVDFSTLSAVIAVKTLGKAFEAVRSKGVPIVWVRPLVRDNPHPVT